MRSIPFTNSAKPKATNVLINFIRLEIYWIHQLPRWHAKICCKQFGRRYPQLAFSSKLGIHIIAKHHFYVLNTSTCQEKQIRKTWLVWHFWMTQSKCPSNFMHFFAEMLTDCWLVLFFPPSGASGASPSTGMAFWSFGWWNPLRRFFSAWALQHSQAEQHLRRSFRHKAVDSANGRKTPSALWFMGHLSLNVVTCSISV